MLKQVINFDSYYQVDLIRMLYKFNVIIDKWDIVFPDNPTPNWYYFFSKLILLIAVISANA